MKPGLKIPTILLEGDEPRPKPASGPGQKFALGPEPTPKPDKPDTLPAGYGTGRLLLAARDPHGLYAHWDSSAAQRHDYEAAAAGRAISVRIYVDSANCQPCKEVHLPQDSQHCFIGVKQAGRTYLAEVGFYQADGRWRPLANSNPVATPPDAPVATAPAEFTTVAFGSGTTQKTNQLQTSAPAPNPAAGRKGNPAPTPPKPAMPPHDFLPVGQPAGLPSAATQSPEWTEAQAEVLRRAGAWAEMTGEDLAPELSAELTHLPEASGVSSVEAAGLKLPRLTISGITSLAGAEGDQRRSFWFHVNAELIIYGATEPGAEVTAAGRPIELRPDGTFSFRLAFPDGSHALSLIARSAQGDRRYARLRFSRATDAGSQ